MILLVHGAFDKRAQRNSGISMLYDMIAELGVSSDVREIDVAEAVTFDPISLLLEPNVYIGYSNGGHRVRDIHNKMMEEAIDPQATFIKAHFIFIDFVYRGLRQLWDRGPLHMADCVQSCLCFYRTQDLLTPPYHNLIARDDSKLFMNIPVESDHGKIVLSSDVQEGVPHRVREIFTA